MIGRQSLVLAAVLLVASVGFSQSLAEMAKKEKERRKQNKDKEVRVIDDEALSDSWQNGGTVSEMGDLTESNSEYPSDLSALPQAQSTPSSGSNSLSGMKQRRQRCEQDLKMAEAEKQRQQDLFNKGVSQVATIDASNSPRQRGSRSTTNVPQYGGSPQTVDVQGRSVSCSQAMSNPSKYSREASTCKSIKAKIDAAEAKRQKALQCLRSR